ncbi:MAG: YdeI/OmpD-associated family protein [Terriglobales bacterium]
MRKTFKTTLTGGGRSGQVAAVIVPFDIKEVWGQGRVPVKGTINGAAFRTTVVKMKGDYFFCVNQQMRADAGGVGPGDRVTVILEPDAVPRTVEVPPDLKKALKANARASATWERYAYTHRKEFAKWIEEAKKPETRARRLAKTIEMLEAGRNLSER